MSAKSLDPQVVTSVMTGVMDEMLSKMSGIAPSSPAENKEIEIDEYEGRMKAVGFEKFEAASYISAVNFYLNKNDLERHKGAKGALILYIDHENASKLYKALTIRVDEDEDDVSMMNAASELCQSLAENFKNKLAEAGYAELAVSEPSNYKNTALRGIEFSPDQKIKFEFSYFYWKRKSLVVEISLTDLPRKR